MSCLVFQKISHVFTVALLGTLVACGTELGSRNAKVPISTTKTGITTTAASTTPFLDVTAPTVTTSSPANNETGITPNAKVSLTFSEPMKSSILNRGAFTLIGPNGAVQGILEYSNQSLIFTPTTALIDGANYSATLTTDPQDVAGNPLAAPYSWNFQVAAKAPINAVAAQPPVLPPASPPVTPFAPAAPIAPADTTPPTVVLTFPAPNATNIVANITISASFSEPLNPATLTSTTVTLTSTSGSVPGAIAYNNNIVTFSPTIKLKDSTTYRTTITTAVQDATGNPLSTAYSWTFTTAAPPPPVPYKVLNGTGLPLAATATCTTELYKDFIDATSWTYRRLVPRDCAVVSDNPPIFSWTHPNDRNKSVPWTFTLRKNTGQAVLTTTTTAPRLMLTSPLPIGDYRWSVTYTALAGSKVTSLERRFTVDQNSNSLEFPDGAAFAALAAQKSHPRLLPAGSTFPEIATVVKNGAGKGAYDSLIGRANNAKSLAGPIEPALKTRNDFASEYDYNQWLQWLKNMSADEGGDIAALGYAGLFTGDRTYTTAGIERLINLASWSPTGSTGEDNQDQANREIYYALAVGFDLYYSKLTTQQRTNIANAIKVRIAKVTARTVELDTYPYNSHLQNNVGWVLDALLHVAGASEYPEAKDLLAQYWPIFYTTINTWGEEDGGTGNNVAYTWYSLISFAQKLANVKLITGINLAQESFVAKFGDLLLSMTTPNNDQLNAFGDGIEVNDLYRGYAHDSYRIYALLTRNPQHAWYSKVTTNTRAGSDLPLQLMLRGLNEATVIPQAPTANDALFGDIGVTAFHDDVASSTRSSVFFKSSRFGSFNHAHADQNSFILNSHGREILISSGYYPYYHSPHHLAVNRATRYKNALTFDQGIGQGEPVANLVSVGNPADSMEIRGELINYSTDTNWSVVTGDATRAYQGTGTPATSLTPLLTNAVRSLAFDRSGKITIVYDWATSDTARRWELNYHALVPFTVSNNTIEINNSPGRACIDHYGLPGQFTQTSVFDVAPENGLPNQNHGRYTASVESSELAVVTVIREDCGNMPVNVTFTGTSAHVAVGTKSIAFDKKQVQLFSN